MSGNSILWTATDLALASPLWERIKGLGYKVLVDEGNEDIVSRIGETLPAVWVGQINGSSDEDLSTLENIGAAYPNLPFILISKTPSVEQAIQVIKLGAVDYITADVTSDRLWAVLERVLKYPNSPTRFERKDPGIAAPLVRPIAVDQSMQKVLRLAEKVARKGATVLIQGESGTGKEVVARYIHSIGDRNKGPFVPVNCAALPENLLESELFGHEKGAFTGAISRKKGKFELANEGTLLLDEISEMPLSLQAKLLRVLQEREIDRVGGQLTVPVDVRVIATTNRNLDSEVEKGSFRLDLFYRLNVVPLHLPPLRQRPEDILPLARFFLEKHGALNTESPKKLGREAEDLLKGHSWPGNVRELENLMERMTLLAESDLIQSRDLIYSMGIKRKAGHSEEHSDRVVPIREMEKNMILRALHQKNGNRSHAAEALGISVRTLRNKLHEYRRELEEERGEYGLGSEG
jgi:DNA-binding NtrC family response regulator